MTVRHDANLQIAFGDIPTAVPAANDPADGFTVDDRFGRGAEMLLMLVAYGGTSVTVTVSQFFGATADAVGDWIAIETGIVVSAGTATYLQVPPAARIHVQATAEAGSCNLLAAFVPGHP